MVYIFLKKDEKPVSILFHQNFGNKNHSEDSVYIYFIFYISLILFVQFTSKVTLYRRYF